MTTPAPDLVELQVPPEQVHIGDLLHDTGDDEVVGPPGPRADDDRYIAVPMRSGGSALLPRDRLVTVRRPRPTVDPAPVDDDPLVELRTHVAEVRDLALALVDAGTVTSPVIRAARDRVLDRIKGTATPTPAPTPAPAPAVKGKP